MKLWTRRLFLEYEGSMPPLPHAKHGTNSSLSPQMQTSSYGNALEGSNHTVFASSVAYVFLILFASFFFIGFVFLYFRQLSTDMEPFGGSIPARRGAGAAALKSLPVVPHPGDGNEVECAICLDDLEEGEAVKMMPQCKHVFHPDCIDTWLDKHVTCPVCRCTNLVGTTESKTREVGSVSEIGRRGQEPELIPNSD
ncbi:hypothetical protein VNO78_05771 [Psophocarpus tetragonolobus]|uniref:RING-type E3 ubiquitin transferase n=1 Tax=Psophocarpus tetragonolobus TaxID=3891 RepID=A0AAN9STF4_PSOTE